MPLGFPRGFFRFSGQGRIPPGLFLKFFLDGKQYSGDNKHYGPVSGLVLKEAVKMTHASYGVKAVELSKNSKLGGASATYVTQDSCPDSCALKKNGCYAENDLVGMITSRLNTDANGQYSPLKIAKIEAAAIGTLSGKRHLRVHVVGDCRSNASAKVVAKAMIGHAKKFGKKAWSYTHAWKTVEASSWLGQSVLASCESTRDAKLAMDRGYAVALVVTDFQSNKAYDLDGLKVIPCPAQVRETNCTKCRLCMGSISLLDKGAVIGFIPHGAKKKSVLFSLSVINR